MEISNSSNSNAAADRAQQSNSPNQPSDENPRAKKAAKQADFEQAVILASMLSGQAQPGIQLSPDGQSQSAALVAQAAAQGTGPNPAIKQAVNGPDLKGVLSAKVDNAQNGSITGALSAGPNRPWSSQWVFGEDQPEMGKPAGMAPQLSPALAKLSEAVAKTGGDTTQVKQAAHETDDALAKLLNDLGAQNVEVTQGAGVPQDGTAQQPKLQLVGGADYLAMMQGHAEAQPDGGQSTDAGTGGQQDRAQASQLAATKAAGSAVAGGAGGTFTVIPGGLAAGGIDGKNSKQVGSKDSDLVAGGAVGAASMQHLGEGPNKMIGPAPAALVTEHVVPGAMMKDRLTSESVQNMTTGIRGMAPQGGGEMKIRLSPENLGDLTIKVRTDGKDVSLQVQASDAGAKKILEESLHSLKDSLSHQQLALGRVSISVNPGSSSSNMDSSQHGNQQGMGNSNLMSGWDSAREQAGRNQSGNGNGYDDSQSMDTRRGAARVSGMSSPQLSARYASARAADDGRIDVMA